MGLVKFILPRSKFVKGAGAAASGYILKRSSPREVVRAVAKMLDGGVPMTSTIARKVVESFRDKSGERSEASSLSRRETEVLQSLSTGSANKEIADCLSITVETVRWHLKQIYQKLHVHGRTEAAVKFMEMQHKQH